MSLKSFFNLLLLTSIIVTSGFSAFFTWGQFLFYLLPLALYLVAKRKLQFHLTEFIPLVISLFVIIVQSINSGSINFNIIGINGLNLFFLFVCAKILISDFTINFIRFSYFISVISLLIWSVLQTNQSFTSFFLTLTNAVPQLSSADDVGQLKTGVRHIIIFSIPEDGDVSRNSGPFYEPGRFVIFILIALSIDFFRINSRNKALSFQKLILIITALTTFSTTGYFALAYIFLSLLLYSGIFRFKNFLALFLLILFVFYSLNFDFILPKVSYELESDFNSSRFQAATYHFGLILLKPIFGWGKGVTSYVDLSPNGLTYIVLVWGMFFSLIYYIYLFRGCKKIFSLNNIEGPPIFLFFLFLILAFSQTITLDPFYFLLMFFGALKKNGKLLVNAN